MHSVTVLGTTVEGWSCAAILSLRLKPTGRKVVVIPVKDQVSAPPALATSPATSRLHGLLRLDERDIVKACHGSFRLATRLIAGGNRSFTFSFGKTGQTDNGVSFLHHWRRAMLEGIDIPFTDYNLAALAAHSGRFAPVAPEGTPAYDFSLQLRGRDYENYLSSCAHHYGAIEAPTPFAETKQDPDGDVSTVILANGETVPTCLVIDASGRDVTGDGAQKEMSAAGDGYLAYGTKPATDNVSLATVTREQGGYTIGIPLRKHYKTASYRRSPGNGTYISNSWLTDPWVRNIIRIGRSASDLEPLFDPFTSILPVELETLLSKLPFNGGIDMLRFEYNRILSETYTRFSDLQHLFHILSDPSPDMSQASDLMTRKIDQFRSRGRVVTYDHEPFDAEVQQQLLLGLGLLPERYDALANMISITQLTSSLKSLSGRLQAAVAQMPEQREWLAGTGIWPATPQPGSAKVKT